MTNKQIIDRLNFFENLFNKSTLSSIESGSELLLLAKKFNLIEPHFCKKYKEVLVKRKIAVLGSFTTYLLISILKLYLYANKISGKFYLGNYDNTVHEFLNPKSELYYFKPDIIILLTIHSDIKFFPTLFSTNIHVREWVNEQIDLYKLYNVSLCGFCDLRVVTMESRS